MFTLQETFETFTTSSDAGTIRRERPPADSLVVLIEDVYCNPTVQTHIAQAIEVLVARHGFRLVNVEGNFDELPLQAHRSMSVDAINELMQQGRVTGPERVGILSPEAIAVVGVDNRELYQRNHKVMKVVMDNQSALAPLLAALGGVGPGLPSSSGDPSAEDRRTAASLSRFLRLEGDNSDVDYVIERRAALTAQTIGNLVGHRTGGLDRLQATLNAAAEFYQVARARQAAFVGGTLANMRKRNTDRSVLVAGNFHSTGVLALLARKQVGCLVFSPKIAGTAASSATYFQRMREQA